MTFSYAHEKQRDETSTLFSVLSIIFGSLSFTQILFILVILYILYRFYGCARKHKSPLNVLNSEIIPYFHHRESIPDGIPRVKLREIFNEFKSGSPDGPSTVS